MEFFEGYETPQYIQKVVYINRVAKVVKGGKRFRFTALVVIGDGNGEVGIGLGKAGEVPEAIRKAVEKAKKSLFKVPLYKKTIPHPIQGKFGTTIVIMKPAAPGTGIIAGWTVRAVMECAGISDIITKCLGSRNPHNVLKSTISALQKLESLEEHLRKRGKTFQRINE